MEVKNPVVDQALINTAAQIPAAQGTGKPKDADQPDFDSMVHQKRSAAEKSEAKAEKPDAKPVRDEAPAEEQRPAGDEQYAIAAAMMFQAQPDMRYAAIRTEAVEAVPELTVELPETPVEDLPAEIVTELVPEAAEQIEPSAEAEPVAPAEPEQTPEIPRQSEEALIEIRDAAPAQTRQPAAEPQERQAEQPMTGAREAQPEPVREEQKAEAPRAVQTEEPEEDADTAQLTQGTPLFEHVEAPVIKVAEAAKPIPLEAENGIEQLGDEIDTILVNDVSANRIEVTLTPENLGRLTVEITRGEDGTLNVVLHATTERTANLLEKGADGLRQVLTANAERAVQIQVRGSEESQQQFLNPDGQNEQNRGQQQQQRNGHRHEQQSAQDFLQQLRLGLVDVDNKE